MKRFCTLVSVLVRLTLVTLTFLPNTFAQGAAPENMVRLVYFLPSDRPARPDRVAALRELIKDAQAFYAEQMESHGFGRKTFRVETDKDGEPVVHQIHGKFEENYYHHNNPDPPDYKVWKELFEHFNDLEHIYFIAIDISQETLGGACGLGGPTFIPSGGGKPRFVFDSAAVRHRGETPGEQILGGSAIIPVSGPCFFGWPDNHPLRVTTHELGHAFGIEHDFRGGSPWDNDTVMGGRGFHLSKSAAEWLSVHRFFNTQSIGDRNRHGSIKLLRLWASGQGDIHLRFEVSDPDGLHQGQLLVPGIIRGESEGAYRLFDYKPLTGKNMTVEFIIDALTADPVDRIMVQIIDKGGSITWATFLTDIASLLPPPKVVSIPDRNLAAAVRKALGFGASAPITDQAMRKLTRLEATESQIKNLKGLEYATQLTELYLYKNQIRTINPLAGLTRLKRLDVDVNQISDIKPLAGLTQLEGLYIGGNQIKNQGVQLLSNLTQLRWLSLGGNQISNIKPLANLTKLQGLWIGGNQIRDVSPLAGLVNLETLKLSGNPIQDTSPLVSLTKLRDVDIEISKPTSVVHVESSNRPPMYWVDAEAGTLHRLVGDEVENLVPNVKNATSLTVDRAGGKLYWTEKTGNTTGKIQHANLDGTNVQLVKKLTSVPHGIAIDTTNSKIYLTNAWGKIQRLTLDGSNFQSNLITGLKAPRHLTLDVANGKVYWTETAAQSGRIQRANLDGSSVQNVATGLTAPLSFAVASGKVYWTSARKLQRANLDGTNSEVLETLPLAPTSIAVDPVPNSLYLTLPSGEIHRRNLDGSGDQPVVTNLGSPGSIVLGISATAPVPTDTPAPPAEPAGDTTADVNQDKKVNKTDLLLVVTALGESPPANPNFDVNADGTVNVADVLLVIEALDDPVAAAAPSFGEPLTALDPRRLAMQIDILRAESDGSMKYDHAIAFFQSLLASIRPTETRLLANYPNPFNPETWIPYQLAKPANVSISIYAADGSLVRRLELGHQPVGIYASRSRAVYWDGRNTVGEPVASGVYFYTLTIGDFTATRKMLIVK